MPLVGPDFQDDHTERKGKRFIILQAREVALFKYKELYLKEIKQTEIKER